MTKSKDRIIDRPVKCKLGQFASSGTNFSVSMGLSKKMVEDFSKESNGTVCIRTEKGLMEGRIVRIQPKGKNEVSFSFRRTDGMFYSGSCNLDTRKGRLCARRT